METIRRASQLYFSNLGAIALLVATVYVPMNAIVFYVVNYVIAPDDFAGAFRIVMILEGIFGPIATGSVIYVAWQASEQSPVTYGQALRTGLSCWGRMFATRLVAGLIIVLGLLAFLVPGIILGLRYALIDSAVVVEGVGGSDARSRSTDLTQGIRIRILLLTFVFYLFFTFVSFLLYIPLAFLPEEAIVLEVGIDYVADLTFSFVEVLLFVFYWQARRGEDQPSPEEDEQIEPETGNRRGLSDRLDDDNPYRSPDLP